MPLTHKKRQLWFHQLIFGKMLNILDLTWVSRDGSKNDKGRELQAVVEKAIAAAQLDHRQIPTENVQ